MNARAPRFDPSLSEKPGLATRDAAMRLFHKVLTTRRALDEEGQSLADTALSPEDRALARAIATTSFRHLGSIRAALDTRVETAWPQDAGLLQPILVTAVAQLLFMNVPDHAAVDLAMTLIHADTRAMRFSKLANAILRRIGREREEILAARADHVRQDLPVWLVERWARSFGEEAADAVALSLRDQPQIDLTLNPQKPEFNRSTIAHISLPSGSLRLTTEARIELIPGFEQGAWWVQDAAAALPAKLLHPRPGMRILDLCAAPGGKTAQLAATGAHVTAVDRSGPRLRRLRENLDRLGLVADIVEADGTMLQADPFDAILIDAPCSATGTIRRHPEISWTRTLEDIAKLVTLQKRLLDHAATLLKPQGVLVFATCSLEREEGERQVDQFLGRHPDFVRIPVRPEEVGGLDMAIDEVGNLRILPHHLSLPAHPDIDLHGGSDGFFAARLQRTLSTV